jgi:ABC-type antimicrobial peptide transport system ATPase subunit
VPGPLDFPSGCRFRDRCDRATEACKVLPPEVDRGAGHRAWCHHPFTDAERESWRNQQTSKSVDGGSHV